MKRSRALGEQGVNLSGEPSLELFRAVIPGMDQTHPSGRVDNHKRRETFRIECLAGVLTPQSNRQSVARVLHKGPSLFRGLSAGLHINGPEADPRVCPVPLVELLKFWHFPSTGGAPSGPVIQNDHTSPKIR